MVREPLSISCIATTHARRTKRTSRIGTARSIEPEPSYPNITLAPHAQHAVALDRVPLDRAQVEGRIAGGYVGRVPGDGSTGQWQGI